MTGGKGMNGVGLFVEDMKKMVSFYCDVLKFETEWDGGLFASFKKGNDRLFMYDRKDFAKAIGEIYYPPNGINLTMEIYLSFPTPEVDKEYERLKNLNVRIICELADQPYGMRNFFIADPEGNLIEIGDGIGL
jgi:catechol 2,3-dioxygenase-like lactoylglutathione lyase family enzyme